MSLTFVLNIVCCEEEDGDIDVNAIKSDDENLDVGGEVSICDERSIERLVKSSKLYREEERKHVREYVVVFVS